MAATIRPKGGIAADVAAASFTAREIFQTTDQIRLYLSDGTNKHIVGLKDNNSATAAPTVNDDAGDGYSVGSKWLDTTADKGYECLDSTVGAAIWFQTSGTGFGTTTPAGSDTEVQFNNSGAFGANAGFTFASDKVTVPHFLATKSSALSGIITSTGDGNNFNPSGWSDATTILLSPSVDGSITGLSGGSAGRIAILRNLSTTKNLSIPHEAAGSSAANRWNTGGHTLYMLPGDGIIAQYDSGTSRWIVVSYLMNPGTGSNQGMLSDERGGTGTNLTGTGGALQVVKRLTADGPFTVAALLAAEIPVINTSSLPTGDWITAQTEESILGGTFSITSSATWQDVTFSGTACEVALATGTWLVFMHARAAGNTSAGNGWISARLYNVDDSAAQVSSEFGLLRNVFTTAPGFGTSSSVPVIVTVTGGPKTYRLQAWRDSTATWVLSDIMSDSIGRTVIRAVRLY